MDCQGLSRSTSNAKVTPLILKIGIRSDQNIIIVLSNSVLPKGLKIASKIYMWLEYLRVSGGLLFHQNMWLFNSLPLALLFCLQSYSQFSAFHQLVGLIHSISPLTETDSDQIRTAEHQLWPGKCSLGCLIRCVDKSTPVPLLAKRPLSTRN